MTTSRRSTREQARALKSAVAYDEAAIREGRKHYLRLCQNCHGKDGRALESFDFEATDLTRPIATVTARPTAISSSRPRKAPATTCRRSRTSSTDQQVWEVVWFLRSIGPESARPQEASDHDPAAVESEAP